MSDDGTLVLSTKISRREYDRFLAIATKLGQTPSTIQRGVPLAGGRARRALGDSATSRGGIRTRLRGTRRRRAEGFARRNEGLGRGRSSLQESDRHRESGRRRCPRGGGARPPSRTG